MPAEAVPIRQLRLTLLVMLALAPLGWAMFYTVFRTVPGQDWVVFHTAAELYFAGDLGLLLDPHAFTAEMNRSHATWLAPIAFHPWLNPPPALLLFLPFGLLRYDVAYVLFLVLTAALMIAALRPWCATPGRRALLVAIVLASPATAFNIGAGQLGFLLTAILACGLYLLPRKPALAGLVLGMLVVKPTFGLMIPVALVAGRHWRAFATCTAAVVAASAASLLLFGPSLWRGWFAFVAGGDPRFHGVIDALHRFDQSVFTSLGTLGVNSHSANVCQAGAALIGAACVATAFARATPPTNRLVVLLCAAMLASPHVAGYDGVMLALAATLTLLEGLDRPYLPAELPIAATVWLSAIITPPALIALLSQPWLTALSAAMPLATLALAVSALRAPKPIWPGLRVHAIGHPVAGVAQG